MIAAKQTTLPKLAPLSMPSIRLQTASFFKKITSPVRFVMVYLFIVGMRVITAVAYLTAEDDKPYVPYRPQDRD